MNESRLAGLLKKSLEPADWYEVLNSKVFFWTSWERAETFLKAASYRKNPKTNQNGKHDIIKVDCEKLLEKYEHSIRVCSFNSGSTLGPKPSDRSLDSFQSISDFSENAAELCVEGGIQSCDLVGGIVEKVFQTGFDESKQPLGEPEEIWRFSDADCANEENQQGLNEFMKKIDKLEKSLKIVSGLSMLTNLGLSQGLDAWREELRQFRNFLTLTYTNAELVDRGKYAPTLLHVAAMHETPYIIVWLLFLDEDSSVSSENGWTPLHTAAAFGPPENVQVLLAAEADPKAQTKNGKFPADLAEHNKRVRNHPVFQELDKARRE